MSKKEVIKHSAVIQISNTINLLQRRAWNVLLANAYNALPNQDEFNMPLREFEKLINFGSTNIFYLKNTLTELVTTKIEFNLLDKDKEKWAVTTLLSQAVISDGYITYAYSPFLKSKLYNPQMYARISLSIQKQFNSKHSLCLYELCIDYFDVSRGYGQTPFINIDDFKYLLGLEKDKYELFKILNSRCIKEPIAEINKKSDLTINVEFKKAGKKVVAVKFIIHKKTEAMLPSPEPEDLFISATNEKLLVKLTGLGITPINKAKNIIERFDCDLIDNWLRCLQEGYIPNLENKPGYLIKALEEGYEFPKGFSYQLEKEELYRRNKTKAEIKVKTDKELDKQSETEHERYLAAINKLTSVEKDSLLKETATEIKLTSDGKLMIAKMPFSIDELNYENYINIESFLLKTGIDGYIKSVLKKWNKL